jgi:hypothetical protein
MTLSQFLVNMDMTQWYAVALGAIAAACVLFSISRVIIKLFHAYASFYFLKYVFYPEILRYLRGSDIITQILRYLRGPDSTTPFDAVLITGFVVGNILCVTIGAGNISGLIGRTGLIAAINLVPLALGGHMNLIASYCGVALGGYGRIHRWLGRVAIIEGSVHSIMAARSRKPDLHVPSQMAALIVSDSISSRKAVLIELLPLFKAISAMATILAFSLAIVQRHFYEIVVKLHLVLAVAVVAGVWVHVWSRKTSVPRTIYMITAICVWASTNLIRLAYILYRNVKYARPRMEDVALGGNPILSEKLAPRRTKRVLMTNQAKVIAMPGGVQVHVKLVRPWRFGAGQTVYLCLPGVSHSAFFQSHPFVLSWWYKSAKGDDIAVFIIRPRRGFTRIVEDIAPKPLEDWMTLARSAKGLELESYDRARSKELTAIIEGPYGNELNLESFDTVLLFASGIRIAAQLPYVRQLLQQHYSWVAKTSRIALFWEMESECM